MLLQVCSQMPMLNISHGRSQSKSFNYKLECVKSQVLYFEGEILATQNCDNCNMCDMHYLNYKVNMSPIPQCHEDQSSYTHTHTHTESRMHWERHQRNFFALMIKSCYCWAWRMLYILLLQDSPMRQSTILTKMQECPIKKAELLHTSL